jgi:hypothetical protein
LFTKDEMAEDWFAGKYARIETHRLYRLDAMTAGR